MPCFTLMSMILQQILTVSTSSYSHFTLINAQVHDVTKYLGWLKMETAAPKAVVASTDIINSWPRTSHVAGLSPSDCFTFSASVGLLCVPTYHMHSNNITEIVAMRLYYFSQLQTAALSTAVATMSSVAQL